MVTFLLFVSYLLSLAPVSLLAAWWLIYRGAFWQKNWRCWEKAAINIPTGVVIASRTYLPQLPVGEPNSLIARVKSLVGKFLPCTVSNTVCKAIFLLFAVVAAAYAILHLWSILLDQQPEVSVKQESKRQWPDVAASLLYVISLAAVPVYWILWELWEEGN